MSLNPSPAAAAAGREARAARHAAARARSLVLAVPLSAEDQCVQSMPDASPAKRHLARPSDRNFFPPAARWQFTGLRLAKDDAC